jgi:hypothetical protein
VKEDLTTIRAMNALQEIMSVDLIIASRMTEAVITDLMVTTVLLMETAPAARVPMTIAMEAITGVMEIAVVTVDTGIAAVAEAIRAIARLTETTGNRVDMAIKAMTARTTTTSVRITGRYRQVMTTGPEKRIRPHPQVRSFLRAKA